MAYRSTQDVIKDLERKGSLIRIKEEVDPYLEMAEIQRQAYKRKIGAVFFEKVKGTSFPCVSNLFGTPEQTDFIFRKTLKNVSAVIQIKANPLNALNPLLALRALRAVIHALPLPRFFSSSVEWGECQISDLPMIQSWPMDGGAFITLPQVFSRDPKHPSLLSSNLGMYRVQLSGNDYDLNQEIGLHYQIHRGIGVHHAAAIALNENLNVAIWVGGPPAHTFAAVMPLPEGLSELVFAGMFAGRNFRFKNKDGYMIACDADFCILGEIAPQGQKPEGPFGDHLGYYSLQHNFPYLTVKKVFHRKNAVWPFTVVGRPPQEDTSFGELIHRVTASLVPKEIPGVKGIHAVDEAGVHPLLLAIGRETYVPYSQRRPMELMTIAHRILGFGQCSLAKYLFVVAGEDNPNLDVNDPMAFFHHLLERFSPETDLHFQTKTTMDTLDYSGEGINQGSKLVIVAAGSCKRVLGSKLPHVTLPESCKDLTLVSKGILTVTAPSYNASLREDLFKSLSDCFAEMNAGSEDQFPLVIVCDDAKELASEESNFLWMTFTRSNPSHDVYGIEPFTESKHYGAKKGFIIDARKKPHHAPELSVDENIKERASLILSRALRDKISTPEKN